LDIKKSDFRYYDHIKANKLVVVNGSFQKHLSEIHENPEEVTIPEMLRQHGYATACFGKWCA